MVPWMGADSEIYDGWLCKSRSPSTIQEKNQQKTISITEKLDVISQFEKGEEIVDIWCKVRLAHSSVCTICDNADRIKDGTKCLDNFKCQNSEIGSVCLCSKTTTVSSE
jgi:hypothetical protein